MSAKADSFWKQALAVFVACVVFYFCGFWLVQRWRTHRGPWQVTFRVPTTNGTPVVSIAQPSLGIRDVRLSFTGADHSLPPPTPDGLSSYRPIRRAREWRCPSF